MPTLKEIEVKEVAFRRPTFLGASVRGFTAQGGLNEQVSQLTVSLVEDPINEDSFTERVGTIGRPISFQYYGFNFRGILQRIEKRYSTEGWPAQFPGFGEKRYAVYEVQLVDPREILKQTQVIINSFNGPVTDGTVYVFNLINAYGWWENELGFGGAGTNESGMPWNKIRTALDAITNNPIYGPYGGPLRHDMGNTALDFDFPFRYTLDISSLPVAPNFYRIGGHGAVNLLSMISQICEDTGCDYFVTLEGFTIKINVVSRWQAGLKPFDTIDLTIQSRIGIDLASARAGAEAVLDTVTSSFLVGGNVTTLYLVDKSAALPFWGYDISGNIIQTTTEIVKRNNISIYNDKNGNPIPVNAADLNASPVVDIISQFTYHVTELELRAALCSKDMWAAYVRAVNPAMADRLNIFSFFENPLQNVNQQLLPKDLKNRSKVFELAKNAVTQSSEVNLTRMYNWIRGVATDYYGKKFLVNLPFIFSHVEDDTQRVILSQEPCEAGWLAEDSPPLGLAPLNINIFTGQDGRYMPLVLYNKIRGADFSHINPADTAIQPGLFNSVVGEVQGDWACFMKSSVNPKVVNTLAGPAVIVTISNPLTDVPVDFVGDPELISKTLNIPIDIVKGFEQLKKLQNHANGAMPLRFAPAIRVPDFFAIPLKDNTKTYGPWFFGTNLNDLRLGGMPGKVKFDADNSLVPWNYGGFEFMKAAANARVLQSVTNTTVFETGQMELAGPPAYSIGAISSIDGPNITNIDVSYSERGIKTTYGFRTFSQRLGVFAAGNANRLRTLGIASQEQRRALRAAVNSALNAQNTVDKAIRSQTAWLAYASPAFKKDGSPHGVLIGSLTDGLNGQVRPGCSAVTYEEAMVTSNAHDDSIFQHTAIMDMTGLVRPFTTSTQDGTPLAGYQKSNTAINGLTQETLNPFGSGHDIEVVAYGNAPAKSLDAYWDNPDVNNTRALALRGPLVISGWGWTTDTDFFTTRTDFLRNSWDWPTAPVDLLYDRHRAVWTSHDLIVGTTQSDIPAGGTGNINVEDGLGAGLGYNLMVHNIFQAVIKSGTKVIAGFIPHSIIYVVISADCPPQQSP